VLSEACQQLSEYFAGDRQTFTVPLELEGTPFEQKVWSGVARIPYGQTATYGRIAKQLGRPKAAQAVGAANAKNPLCIFVPCHRVIGSDRSLVGYAGGLVAKRDLLHLEYQHGPGRLGETIPLPLE
jgi:methylated-DNA-[protein]-cysteine S-methyltransferase